jgi:hypothetical protein
MAITVCSLTLEELSHAATAIGVTVGLVTYITATRAQARQRRIDNAMRYWDCHAKLFAPDGYCKLNVKAMEAGTFKREPNDLAMETKFNELLSNCEHVALLQRTGVVPKSLDAYMFGWFAKQIFPALTDREKAEPYWEVAVEYIREAKLSAERLDTMPKEERSAYLKKNHFA